MIRVVAINKPWLICLHVLLLCLVSACGQSGTSSAEQLEIHGQTMGTTYSVKVVDAPKGLTADTLKPALDRELAVINQAMSTYIEDSDLSRFNRAQPQQWQPVPDMLMTVLTEARRIYVLSEGAFDPSIGPLVNLWGFGPELNVEFPAEEAIRAAQAKVGFAALEMDRERGSIRKSRDMYVDLSAIAKGYAVDRLAGLLQARGIERFLVEVGGELRGHGHNAQDRPWRIAIEKPDPSQRAVHGVIQIENMAMATSGDYRNFFEKDGRRYSHTIDPRTGYPVSHGLLSVTVLTEQAMTADALATAFMVMGSAQAYELAEAEQVAAWFVQQEDGQLVDKLTTKMRSYRLH